MSDLVKTQPLRSIDLFAGIGGIRLGFERAFGDEISTVFVSEWDEQAQRTYKANFHDNFSIEGDITVLRRESPGFQSGDERRVPV